MTQPVTKAKSPNRRKAIVKLRGKRAREIESTAAAAKAHGVLSFTISTPDDPTGSPKRRGRWKSANVTRRLSYLDLFLADPLYRIALVRSGVAAAEAKRVLADLKGPLAKTLEALDLPTATLNRKAKANARLSPQESERVVGVAKLIGQVQAMVEVSGEPEGFSATEWVANWLREPLPALGGVRPLDLMSTMEGQSLVAGTLSRIQSGAYA